MQILPADYEKPGVFYLGREYDPAARALLDSLVLYDSKDLVTHGVVLGMTGSGKTGLCFTLLEEAAMDRIPAIVIDPKGDLSNLLLTFPDLTGEAFRPWINEEDAAKAGVPPEVFADKEAEKWTKGLADWGQSAERIRTLRATVDISIYTPGSNAGIPVSILSSLQAPEFEIVDDSELFSERIEGTVSGLLGLLNITADPVNSRDHILLSNIFGHAWRQEESLDLEKLIHRVQQPPFAKVGVIELDTFFPEKKRTELAMALNNLLAAPGFATWLTGEPLDIKRMLHTPEGKPRISVFSIAHLGDSERMFFVTLLLEHMTGWMRTQSGTSSLRALLYMDEIAGYLPPVQNPPSKKPMLTLLKQSRAFGLGLLLATQNPVDLDYKALSNIGTWFLGRLQTERDKARVLDGLEGAAASRGGGFDRAALDRMLSGLSNRVFLMNNVHEDGPAVFQVRWAMSYLRGPLTRSQIKKLMDPQRAASAGSTSSAPAPSAPGPAAVSESTKNAAVPEKPGLSRTRPALPESIPQFFAPPDPAAAGGTSVYRPALLCSAEMTFSDKPRGVFVVRQVSLLQPLDQNAAAPREEDFQRTRLRAETLAAEPDGSLSAQNVRWVDPPSFARKPAAFSAAEKRAGDWLYRNETVELLRCAEHDFVSRPGESEGEFRARLSHAMREQRDAETEKLRAKYLKQFRGLETERDRLETALERERQQARSAKLDTAVSIGQTVLGAIFGRKILSGGNIGRGGTAMRKAGRAYQQSGDIDRAEDRLHAVEEEMATLKAEMDGQLSRIRFTATEGAAHLPLETVTIRALKKNIYITRCGLVWIPDHAAV